MHGCLLATSKPPLKPRCRITLQWPCSARAGSYPVGDGVMAVSLRSLARRLQRDAVQTWRPVSL